MKTRFLIWLLLILAVPCCAEKIVVVLLPATSLGDFTEMPALAKIIESGAVGVMNSRTAGVLDREPGSFVDTMYTPESDYVTLGAGARAIAGADARRAYNRSERLHRTPVQAIYGCQTLRDSDAEVLHLSAQKMSRDCKRLPYESTPGMLGEALHAAGLSTAVLGNSDDTHVHREAATICMDSQGQVDFGDVGRGMTMPDPSFPTGRRADISRVLAEARRCLKEADLLVIEFGDTARLDRARLDMTEEAYLKEKTRTLRRAGMLVQSVSEMRPDILIVVSPYPSSESIEKTNNSLCPIAVSGLGRGVLTSGTTRTEGVVANTDLAPSILSWLGVTANGLVGRHITVAPESQSAARVAETEKHIYTQRTAQPVLRYTAVACTILVALVTLALIFTPGNFGLLAPFVLLTTAVAPAMLALSLMPPKSQADAGIKLVLLAVGMVIAALAATRKPIPALALICSVFAVAVVIDLLSGCPLSRFSIMSYSIIEGSRYYGIGNEFMGAFLGASFVGVGIILRGASERAARTVLTCGLILSALIIGAPNLGANVGGSIAAVAGFGTALAAVSGKTLRLRRLAGIGGVTVLVLLFFAVLDSLRAPEAQSHLGKTISLILSGGPGQMWLVVKRKLSMNLLLLQVSPWSRLLLAYVASSVIIGAQVAKRFRIAVLGGLGGILAALIFNDSGVVAAGTAGAYLWALTVLSATIKKGGTVKPAPPD
ncbi:MAG: hypothetical protein ACYC2Y_05680 [Armatimonadota bacterium]